MWGEGERGPAAVTPRGSRPIDVGYNVEESLPNLALYGSLTGDEVVMGAVAESLRAHLPFLLPDGGWDAGWCGRQYKWSYLGSRTSDGCASGFALLRAHDARFATAAALNLALLGSCTHYGLLEGGLHLHSRGITPCIHHTFCHAKGLAAALDVGWNGEAGAPLESAPDGVYEWPEAAVFQLRRGPWRATMTANDLPHTPKRGGYPSGGALSMLWHERIGPLCVASMNDYVRYEGGNMQLPSSEAEAFPLTPRLEQRVGDDRFSSLDDREARLETSQTTGHLEIIARGTLKNRDGVAAPDGGFVMVYRCADDFEITVQCHAPDVRLVVPVVSTPREAVHHENGALDLQPHATVRLQIEGAPLEIAPNEHVFNFVPGVEALPVSCPLMPHQAARLRFAVR